MRFSQGLVAVAYQLDDVLPGSHVLQLLRERADLFAVHEEFYGAGGGGCHADPGALTCSSEGYVQHGVLAARDLHSLVSGWLIARRSHFDHVGATREFGNAAGGGVTALTAIHEDLNGIHGLVPRTGHGDYEGSALGQHQNDQGRHQAHREQRRQSHKGSFASTTAGLRLGLGLSLWNRRHGCLGNRRHRHRRRHRRHSAHWRNRHTGRCGATGLA